MSKIIFVTPKKDYKIRDPYTKTFLPETGMEVEDSLYWHRLSMDGDVTVSDVAPASASSSKTSK